MGTPMVQLRGAEAGSHPQDPGNQVARAQWPSRQAYPFLRSRASCRWVPLPAPKPTLYTRGGASTPPPPPHWPRTAVTASPSPTALAVWVPVWWPPPEDRAPPQQGHLANRSVSPVSGGRGPLKEKRHEYYTLHRYKV